MRRDWSEGENDAAVADYFEMLLSELAGQRVNKAEHNRMLRRSLDDRRAGAVEFKHGNISAVLIDLGCQYVSGYKPAFNYQQQLRDTVVRHLERNPSLCEVLSADADRSAESPAIDDILGIEEDVPEGSPPASRVTDSRGGGLSGIPNYLEREARNRALGYEGELLAIKFERARLRRVGRADLAGRIEHVSVDRGDGDGFDILSFEDTGRERFVEVKTTKYGSYTPFFLTRNELHVSQSAADRYHIYRLFAFREQPRLYTLRGDVAESCVLTSTTYMARVR
ncbi:MAG: DUF3883 domain-containing protein [Candidatus Binatia bacterium]